ncbi:MAG TPA: hypothetical protein DFS52_06960 [Myxococcales bacterium]|nr:hypothetical protein [Myxococcales bacterium]
MQAVRARDLALFYVLDNSFEDLSRPKWLFADWFESCGLTFVCPQVCEKGSSGAMEEARAATAEKRSAVFLDCTAGEGDLEPVLKLGEAPGVITIARSEAPGPSTRCHVRLPKELR